MKQQWLYCMAGLSCLTVVAILIYFSITSARADEQRIFVELPKKMQQHMLANMRDHLAALNQILIHLGEDELDNAAKIAEYQLGMSSLDSHGASHMARFMPEGMREIGAEMHRSASRFALIAQEGEVQPAYQALADVTSACVACHAGYRIQ